MKGTDLQRLTQQQAAFLLSVAPRTLRDWPDAPRNEDGTYPGAALVAYYLNKSGGDMEFADQRQRLAAAQAEKTETENAVRRGELRIASHVDRVWSDHIAAARAKLLSMPSKLAPQITDIHEPQLIAAAIRAEVTAALAELAEYEPDELAGVQDVEAPADTDDQPVGGRRKKAQ